MRLPADATLIVVGAPVGADDARAAAGIASLLDAWRREELPAIDARALRSAAFADGRLEARLDELGATTLVLCGGRGAAGRAARDAEALGFHAFVVGDACWRDDFSSAAGPGGTSAVVDTATALAAAALAKARQRRGEPGSR